MVESFIHLITFPMKICDTFHQLCSSLILQYIFDEIYFLNKIGLIAVAEGLLRKSQVGTLKNEIKTIPIILEKLPKIPGFQYL